MQVAHSMPFGATLLADGGGVDFRLWAPSAAKVELLLGDDAKAERVEVTRDDGGWCAVRVPQAQAGTRYRWWVADAQGDGCAVPDPASRWNPTGPHGPSVVVDAQAFKWDDDWLGRPWHEAVIYELHVGTFTPEGTYAAAEAKLPALAELGITAVELMPLSSFPGRYGWGYDGVLPYAPHAAYGDPQALKHFIQAAHRLGLQVMLDVVYNHFGPDGNYLHQYAKSFFSSRHHTAWGDAINFDGDDATPVREFFIHNALYWIEEYRFDGLRFDAVHAIVDDGLLHILKAISARVRAGLPAARLVHLVLENEHHESRWLGPPASIGHYEAQWNDGFHHAMHVLLSGEAHGYYEPYAKPAGEPIAALVRALSRGYAKGPQAKGGAAVNGADVLPATTLEDAGPQPDPPLSATVNFLQNHDQIGNRAFGERIDALVKTPAPLRLGLAITLLGPAPPMLFMGEEWRATTPFLYFADWQGELREAVSAGRLREFAAFAEAAAAGGEPLPDACDEATFLRSKLDWAEADAPVHRAWRDWMRSALAARRRWIEPHLLTLQTSGHASWIGTPGAAASLIAVRWRFDGGLALELRANLSEQSVAAAAGPDWPPLENPRLVFSVGEADGGGGHDWAPWSGRWMLGHEGAEGASRPSPPKHG